MLEYSRHHGIRIPFEVPIRPERSRLHRIGRAGRRPGRPGRRAHAPAPRAEGRTPRADRGRRALPDPRRAVPQLQRLAKDPAEGLGGHRGAPRQHPRSPDLLGAVRARAGQVRHLDRGRASRGSPRAPGAARAPVVRHLEERQLALPADVDEAAAGAVPADHRQGRSSRRLAVAPRAGPARGGHPGLPRAHAPPQGGRPAAHRDPGAGRERARRLERDPRLPLPPRRSSSRLLSRWSC